MSYKDEVYKDEVVDYVQDHGLDMLKEWIETDQGLDNFEAWFWSKKQDDMRDRIFSKFLEDYKAEEVVAFNEYACQEAYERLSSGPEEDERGDR